MPYQHIPHPPTPATPLYAHSPPSTSPLPPCPSTPTHLPAPPPLPPRPSTPTHLPHSRHPPLCPLTSQHPPPPATPLYAHSPPSTSLNCRAMNSCWERSQCSSIERMRGKSVTANACSLIARRTSVNLIFDVSV